MNDLKHYPGMPEEYINRKLTERVNAIENNAVLIDTATGQITSPSAQEAVLAASASLVSGQWITVPASRSRSILLAARSATSRHPATTWAHGWRP